jgi:hypothetical protein
MQATWTPYEKRGRLTAKADLPDTVFAFPKQRKESWLRESGQSVEWIFCLTAARVLVANQEQR